jgi:von Willebrand factor type A domain
MLWALALTAQGQRADTIDLSVLRVDAAAFPVVRVYFRAEGQDGRDLPAFDLDSLRVLENGSSTLLSGVEAVADSVPAQIALVLDRSASMMDDFLYRFDTVGGQLLLAPEAMRAPGAPRPFAQAQAAILRLAAQFGRAGDGLVLVSFSDRVDPVAAMRSDTTPLASALRGLRATGRTAFYDALLAALDALAEAPGLRAVVALTDGSDNASQADAQAVLARARAVQAPLFLVGLGNVDRDTLRQLAAGSRGACYFPADGRMLMPIYRDIGRRVRHIYRAQYRSFYPAQAGEAVRIELRLDRDDLHLRGHGGRYHVPASALEPGRATRNLRGILLGAAALLGLFLLGLVLRALARRLRPRGAIPDLPVSLPPPIVHPTPTRGPLAVTLRLAGHSPMGWLLLATREGRVLRRYECSGQHVVLQLSVADLAPGRYQLVLIDGQARSEAVDVLRVRG